MASPPPDDDERPLRCGPPSPRLDRRDLLRLGLGALVLACTRELAPEEALLALLELEGNEARWLEDLSDGEVEDLRAALASGGEPTDRAVELVFKVIGRRSRLFPYVGYERVGDLPKLCDGLLRE